jgi:hypothetical protein
MAGLNRAISSFAPRRIQQWIRLVCALAACAALPLGAATFTASLDRDTILLGDTATLALTFAGGDPGGGLQLPNIPGLQVISSGQSSQFSFSNGQSTSTVTHNFVIKPAQTGDFTIPALTAKVGGETLTSQPVKFKVVRAAAPTPGSEAEQQQLALLRVVLPKQEVFVGETIVVELQLLIRSGVQNISNPDLPFTVDGCTAGKLVSGPQRQTVIGSTPFTLFPLSVPVTVMKTGTLQVGPVDGNLVVTLPSRQRDRFDPFGMFNSGVQQRVAFSAAAQSLNALPLPEAGKPATFSGAVGTFEMSMSAGPTNVAVGDPITIRAQIQGRGALDSFTLPDQPAWKDFKTYPPTAKVETTGNLGLEGIKSFEQVVVPQNTEIKELPAFEFSYFDPGKRAYATLRHPATAIIVRPGGSAPTPTIAIGGLQKTDEAPPAQDIVHIKPRLGKVTRNITPWIRQSWFLALQALPLLALAGVVVMRKRAEALANNPRLRRQRQVAQIVREGLLELRRHAAEKNSDAFFATVVRLVQEQIGERLDLPASAITEAIVDEKLRPAGARDGTCAALHELFQLCNQARYAPVQSAQELEAVIPKLETALRELQEVKA